ncbi:hypothetical protein BVRB_009150 [Beta vulgaris subsp. vulgaris]|uniref:Uncharacterized protein n=1 Tax=Beta vulgaris subsp. vulgaris TaxID=3555 RepID=A0A0J8B2J9_BETVV|nr:hypothetical protein BVRB_009150 [Beta vulgaris subsp. vulgaris]
MTWCFWCCWRAVPPSSSCSECCCSFDAVAEVLPALVQQQFFLL